uniref:Phenazine biosynthesis like protein domain containing n=2 Tax=Latimeria chalumnae TaxID=7897 RepID=H3B0G2_LATCH|nr:PREDICTED: phenazine biosynthesis-like domain-containing protein [Latimeria chalumnae]|eukprot:XP_005990012.1 PREDICTED: phenazine biosynthesis-like domain-containing protein [Latimeria chalumnae]
MQISIFTVDAFTNCPFSGNPAAVCLLESELNEDLHQNIAAEMNLSETAFIRKLNPSDSFSKSSCFGLRWFTPTNEVPLCGHATLASAAVLFQIKENSNSVLTFKTLSGDLYARQAGDHIVLDMPLYPTTAEDSQQVKELVKTALGDIRTQDIRYAPATKKLLVRLSDIYERSVLEKLKVDPQAVLLAEKTGKVKGLIITLKRSVSEKAGKYDFYCRYFAPWNGIPEDPVTGSAYTVLGSYWSEQLGKTEMFARQCSQRGGDLRISVRGDGRVDIAGQVVIVLKGNLTI